MRRILPIAVIAALPFVGLAALPAAAAPVEPADDFIISDWDSGTVYSVDPATGVATEIGESGVFEVSGIDIDFATGIGYAVDWPSGGDATLYSVDAATGAFTAIADINDGGDGNYNDCTGLDFSAGVITVTCATLDQPNQWLIGSVDPTTAELTVIVDNSTHRFSALAVNPVDGVFYAVQYQTGPDPSRLHVVNRAAGTTTLLGPIPGSDIYAADFDGTGSMHVLNAAGDYAALGTVNPASLTLTVGADVVDAEGDGIFAEALTVNGIVPPKPLLPATGSEISVVPLALAGLLALLIGGALIGRRRARV